MGCPEAELSALANLDTNTTLKQIELFENFDPSLKHVLVFTKAGKPVWARHGDEEANSVLMGILFTLFSIVEENDDVLQEIELGGGSKMVYYHIEPLILVSIGFGTGKQMHFELQIVRDQILSLISGGEIKRRYELSSTFDLRRYICGSERFLHSICDSIETDPAFFLQSTQLVPLSAAKRDAIGSILSSCRDPGTDPGLVFSLLCIDSRVLCMCQDKHLPKFHPIDILLLLNLLKNQESLKDSEVWLPICLPRLEENHSLQAHISYIPETDNRMCLVLISNNRSPDTFHHLRKCKEDIGRKLIAKNLIAPVLSSSEDYLTSDAGIPELRHFMYCSNANNQVTVPSGYDSDCLARYRALFSMVTSGEVKLIYRSNVKSVNVAWKTKSFLLFAAFGPLVHRRLVIQSITKLLQWLRKRETDLFATKDYFY